MQCTWLEVLLQVYPSAGKLQIRKVNSQLAICFEASNCDERHKEKFSHYTIVKKKNRNWKENDFHSLRLSLAFQSLQSGIHSGLTSENLRKSLKIAF